MLHKAVLFHEVIEGLNIRPSGIYVDCTGGAGGHSSGILEKLGPDGKLFIFDRDTQSIQRLKKRFEDSRCVVSEARFSEAFGALQKLGVRAVDGVLADLGFSSIQLEDPTRGLSFQKEGPLDMRLDARLEHTASDLLLSLPEKNLADLFYHYGEEYRSRAVARAVVKCRGNPLWLPNAGQAQGPAPTSFFASITRVGRCSGWMHFRADTGVCPYAINFPVAGVALCGYPPVCDIGVGVTPRGYPPGNVHGGVHFRADTGVCPYTFKPRM